LKGITINNEGFDASDITPKYLLKFLMGVGIEDWKEHLKEMKVGPSFTSKAK